MAPAIFLVRSAKKVDRRKSICINGFWMDIRLQEWTNGAFCPSKKRHFAPFFPCPIWAATSLGSQGENHEWGGRSARWAFA